MKRHLPVLDEPIFQVRSDGSSWKRVGECNRCGDCCSAAHSADDPFEGRIERRLEGMCHALRQQPDGTRTCVVHGTDEPFWKNGCRTWPNKVEHLTQDHMGRCSFAFVKVE